MSRWGRLWILAIALAPMAWAAFRSGERLVVGEVSFSPDGQALASVCDPQHPQPHAQLRVWDLATGRERIRFQHRDDPPYWPVVAAWIWAAAWAATAVGWSIAKRRGWSDRTGRTRTVPSFRHPVN